MAGWKVGGGTVLPHFAQTDPEDSALRPLVAHSSEDAVGSMRRAHATSASNLLTLHSSSLKEEFGQIAQFSNFSRRLKTAF